MKTDLQLTKRELFAALICAGYSANPKVNASFEAVARDCVVRACDAAVSHLYRWFELDSEEREGEKPAS